MNTYGLHFPLIIEDGVLLEPSLVDSIDTSLRTILAYPVYQRFFSLQFGSILPLTLGSPLSESSLAMMRIYLLQSIQLWEKRVEVESLEFFPDYDEGSLYLEIKGIIPALQNSIYSYSIKL